MIPHPSMPYPRTQHLLARDEVHYVGQTMAMVVAESRYIAEDALELIEADLHSLPAVVDIEAAVPGRARPPTPTRRGTSRRISSRSSATRTPRSRRRTSTFTERYVVERSAGMAMETRGVLGEVRPANARAPRCGTRPRRPSRSRGRWAPCSGSPTTRCASSQPDTGRRVRDEGQCSIPRRCSSRGPRCELERPVKYVEDRVEHFIGSIARAQADP